VTETLGELPERASVHLDRGYDSKATRKRLEEQRGLLAEIAQKSKPAPLTATKRWVVVERTSSWHNAHKKKLCVVYRKAGAGD
jgi:IS5 family transposase